MTLAAGSRITAAYVNAFCTPQEVIKAADQSVTSSTVLVNDNALFLPVVATGTYDVNVVVIYEGGTQGSSDIKFQFTVPTAATLRMGSLWISTGGVVIAGGVVPDTTVFNAGSSGAGNLHSLLMDGTLIVSSTAGNLQFQWAQNTSSGTATIVHAQSKIRLWRIT